MKQNFSNSEIEQATKTFEGLLKVETNKYGNLNFIPVNPIQTSHYCFGKGTKYFTFYRPDFKKGKIIIRSLTKFDSGLLANIHPLNMKRGKVYSETWGEWFNTYNINDSYFDTFEDAMNYFTKYINKRYAA